MMGNYDKSLLHISLAVIILNIFEAYKCCKLNIYINNWYNARKICCVLSSWQECSPTSWINVNKLPEGINDVEISPVISGEKCVAMHWQMLRLSGICFFFIIIIASKWLWEIFSLRTDCFISWTISFIESIKLHASEGGNVRSKWVKFSSGGRTSLPRHVCCLCATLPAVSSWEPNLVTFKLPASLCADVLVPVEELFHLGDLSRAASSLRSQALYYYCCICYRRADRMTGWLLPEKRILC